MPRLTAGEAARLTRGLLVGDAEETAHRFVADSREVTDGTAFVAIRGGHEHVGEAMAAGAPFAVLERPEVLPEGTTGVVVEDVVAALGALAAEWRDRLSVRVVGITGSTGKTLTKDLIAAAAAAELRVHAAPGSYNNEIGVPLVILGASDDADALVLELGARRAGEIAELARIARPDVGVITGIGVTHLGIFGDRETIARTKSELLAGLPAAGLAIVPSHDDFLHLKVTSTAARVATVGPGGHVRVLVRRLDDRGHAEAEIDLGDAGTVGVRLAIPGRAILRNAAMALRAAVELGVDPGDAAAAIASADLSSWRLEVDRIGGRLIVNDAYNANPTSVAAALRTVREIAGDRQAWAVLGEMAELGPIAHAEHVRVGRLARALGYARVVAVGDEAGGVAEGAGDDADRVPDAEAAASLVDAEAAPDAVVLVKASRVVGLERIPALLEGGAASGVSGR